MKKLSKIKKDFGVNAKAMVWDCECSSSCMDDAGSSESNKHISRSQFRYANPS
ncbi:hypothetical protein [Dethiothermospora halolimnae]|uniref:hypothetical protein n=1 Tax=Dethiothermospora halolimnae TaxID=3114390 RepID=UPI003CCBBE21